MIGSIDIIASFFLFLIVYQDFTTRSISVYSAFILFVLLAFKSIYLLGWEMAGTNFIFNVAFILLQLTLTSFYFMLKNRKVINIIDQYLGLGDIVFLLIICLIFSPINFLIFYVCSIFLTLVATVLSKLYKTSDQSAIPLAGWMSFHLLTLFAVKYSLFPFTFENDEGLVNMLYPWMISIK